MEPKSGSSVKSRSQPDKETSAKLGFNALYDISELLECGLDKKSLAICCRLLQEGVNPKNLAGAIIAMKTTVQDHNLQQDQKKYDFKSIS